MFSSISTYFNGPSVLNPINSFSVQTDFISLPSQNEMQKIQKDLGNRFKSEAECNNSITSQKVSNAAFAGLTVGVACLNPFLAIPVGLIGLLNYFTINYDSLEERNEAMKNIASRSFSSIATSHSCENVIGYELLNEISVVKDSNPEQKAFLYMVFQRLANEFKNLKEWKRVEEDQIDKKWSKAVSNTLGNIDAFSPSAKNATAPLNEWRNAEMNKIEKVYIKNVKILNAKFSEMFDEKSWVKRLVQQIS